MSGRGRPRPVLPRHNGGGSGSSERGGGSMSDILEEQAIEEGTEASPRMMKSDSLSYHGRAGENASPIPEDEVLDMGEEGEEEEKGEEGEGGARGGAAGELPGREGAFTSEALPAAAPASSLPPYLRQSASVGARPSSPSRSSKYTPLPWSDYFQESFDVTFPEGDKFHIYRSGNGDPVVFCLHGGGYSGLSFAVAAGQIRQQQQRGVSLGLPGSPSSSVSALTVVAMDLRGHGLTVTRDDADLSADTLCADVIRVINHLYPGDPPPIVLVGHSMGGAIAVRVAAKQELPSLHGLVVVDVVEGTAMASLVHMQAILAARPSKFPSLEKAVEWTLRNGHIRNPESARVSVPSTLVYDEASKAYVWRAPLEESEKFWKGWYTGLSEVFLQSPVPKVLLLAGTDRLDKPLTIAQMQGKFQMLVVRYSGHAIQEDEPAEFASSLIHFIARNRISSHNTLFARWGGPIHP